MPKFVFQPLQMHSKCKCGYEITCVESKYKMLKRLHHKKCKFPIVPIDYLNIQEVIVDNTTSRIVKDERTKDTKGLSVLN